MYFFYLNIFFIYTFIDTPNLYPRSVSGSLILLGGFLSG